MKIGDLVKIDKCEQCPAIVGKTVLVSKINVKDNRTVSVVLNFGRGRPQMNRPSVLGIADISIVENS